VARAADVEKAVRNLVALQRVRETVADRAERRRLARVMNSLRADIGVGVPKRRAAALLAVSVPALERWITAGRLPVAARPGSSREEIDADALVDLATEVDRLREAGESRGVLAAAFRNLAVEGKPAAKLRPNESPRELRQSYLRTTPLDRLREAAELSYAATYLAQRGRQPR
jgi:hypothetical protein